MIPQFDKDKQVITTTQRYLGTLITTRDIDEFRREEIRQERIFQRFISPTLYPYSIKMKLYC